MNMAENVSGAESPGAERETVLLVGASSGIGAEIIRRLAPDNPLILAHYNRSLANLEQLRQSLPGLEIAPIQADLAREDEVERFVATVRGEYPLPDKVVHLAAPKLEYIRFKDMRWDFFQRELDLQLRSLMAILQAFLPAMAQRKRGKVVVVLSSVTLNVPPGAMAHYVTAKYAQWGLVRALASEYSAKRLNINAVSPSMVETAFLEKLPDRMVEITAASSPFQRNATPHDVAAAVRFLLSTDADYLTGVNLPISGGSVF